LAEERFYFWRGFYDALKMLETDEQRGAFILALCAYAFDGEESDLSWDPIIDFAFHAIKEQVAESVRIGVRNSTAGSKGGRPRKTSSGTKKSTVKSTAKSAALSGAKSTVKSGAESVEYSNVLSQSSIERECGPSTAPDGASPDLSGGVTIPPRPSDWSD